MECDTIDPGCRDCRVDCEIVFAEKLAISSQERDRCITRRILATRRVKKWTSIRVKWSGSRPCPPTASRSWCLQWKWLWSSNSWREGLSRCLVHHRGWSLRCHQVCVGVVPGEAAWQRAVLNKYTPAVVDDATQGEGLG